MRQRLAPAIAILGVVYCSHASAFCRKTTCESTPLPEGCHGSFNENGCSNEGEPVHWESPCFSFAVQRDGSTTNGISADELEALVQAAFDTWTTVACSGGGTPNFLAVQYPQVTCDEVGYRVGGPNQNLWVFRDDSWEYDIVTDGALALTTLSINPATGAIYDADVELNAFQNYFTLQDNQVETDLYSIVLHEAGHVLGIGHSDWATSTMGEGYFRGSLDMSTLEADDELAICSIMPPGELPKQCDPEPRYGFSKYCAEPPHRGCCSVGRGPPELAHALGWLVGLSILALSRRRTTRRPTSM